MFVAPVLKYMELQKSSSRCRFLAMISSMGLTLLASCVGIKMGGEVNLGGDYYYVQDYPQCICSYSRSGEVVLPHNADGIIVRVQYNDTIVLATWSSGYDSRDTMLYVLDKTNGRVYNREDYGPLPSRFENEVHNARWYQANRP